MIRLGAHRKRAGLAGMFALFVSLLVQAGALAHVHEHAYEQDEQGTESAEFCGLCLVLDRCDDELPSAAAVPPRNDWTLQFRSVSSDAAHAPTWRSRAQPRAPPFAPAK